MTQTSQGGDLAIRWGRPLSAPAAWGLLAAAVVLVVGYLADTVYLAPLTVPAALLGPGYAVMASMAQALERDLDSWLAWVLRVLLSVAAWTVAGVALLVLGMLPWRAVWPVTAYMAVFALLGIRRAGGAASLRDALGALRASWRSPGVVVVAGLVVCGLVALPFAVSLSRAPVEGQQFVTLTVQPAGDLVTGADGTVNAQALVASHLPASGKATTITVRLLVDGRQVTTGGALLGPDATVDVSLTGQWGRCWKTGVVTVSGLDASLTPRPLTLHNGRGC